jgi:hypothetical protein
METNLTKHSLPYITGMGYRFKCDFIYDEFEKFDINNIDQFDGMKIFVKTDYLSEFSGLLSKIKKNFTLFTHNSDIPITTSNLNISNHPHLITWFAQNVNVTHEKIKSIPIGLANKRWDHGNIETLKGVLEKNHKKDNLVFCGFDVNTNIKERMECLNNIQPYSISKKLSFDEYLTNVSKSYFTISPNGNGIDCHKHWESMYLKTIPIVTKSINISHYNDYPFLVIDNWSDFGDLTLTKELYHKIWGNFHLNNLYL